MRRERLVRVLALDLHPRRFGYVVLEGPDRLLDWGVRSYRRKGKPSDALIPTRLRPLLESWDLSVLILHSPTIKPRLVDRGQGRVLKRIAMEAKKYRVHLRIPKEGPRKDQNSRLTKYENAQLVAGRFPVLRSILPEKRKPWESEDYRISIFTAAALAMVQLHIAFDSTPEFPRPLSLHCSHRIAPTRSSYSW